MLVGHVRACALQHGERGMPFVQMAHLWIHARRTEQPPAADAEHQLLLQPKLPVATVQLARDAAMDGDVGGSLLSNRYSFALPTFACQARSQTE